MARRAARADSIDGGTCAEDWQAQGKLKAVDQKQGRGGDAGWQVEVWDILLTAPEVLPDLPARSAVGIKGRSENARSSLVSQECPHSAGLAPRSQW